MTRIFTPTVPAITGSTIPRRGLNLTPLILLWLALVNLQAKRVHVFLDVKIEELELDYVRYFILNFFEKLERTSSKSISWSPLMTIPMNLLACKITSTLSWKTLSLFPIKPRLTLKTLKLTFFTKASNSLSSLTN